MSGSQRTLITLATPITQITCAGVLGLVLSWLGRGDASGWGDLVGAVIGMLLGAGVGLGVMLVVATRALGRSGRHLIAHLVLAVPSALVASAVIGATGIDVRMAYGGYLVACAALMWWYTGGAATGGEH